jgi:serine/threonine protein kinase
VFAEHLHEGLDRKVCLECNRQFTGIVAACPHDGTNLIPLARDPMVGTCLMGKYDIIDVIGHGGMGVVYKGRQVLMDRTVAIKMLQSQHIADSMSVKRFHQEGKAASKMNHPHVITVYDFGVTPNSGQPFIVMDYLLGTDLSTIIKEEGQLGVERSLKILAQSTDALDHAHRMGVIHRDLKPSNIMLIDYEDEKDFVKVVDFGVAKLISAGGEQQRLTQMGEVCGSPVYMSPEQCQGLELDNRSDIYSMGIVIYETLTGRLPILGKTMVETMSKHITEAPPRFKEVRPDLYIPERLEAVVFKALAKSPADRHQTMAELTRDLDTAIPRAGKSQVLRTDFPTMPDDESDQKKSPLASLTPFHWVAIAATLLLVLGIGGKIAMDATFKKPEVKQAIVAPATGGGASTGPSGNAPAGTGPSTATASPVGTASTSSASTSTSGSANKTTAVALPGSNATNSGAVRTANSSGSNTVTTSTVERPRPVVRQSSAVKRIASQPKVKQVSKPRATAAAPSSGAGNPWADLKMEKSFK